METHIPAKNKGGRPKGRLNKATAEVKKLAQKHGKEAVKTLVKLMQTGETQTIKLAAAKELIDRAYGKASQAVEHTGPQGDPIQVFIHQLPPRPDPSTIKPEFE
jgi:hypothetical protein